MWATKVASAIYDPNRRGPANTLNQALPGLTLNIWKRPVADIRSIADASVMRCFYVLVHGRLRWRAEPAPIENDGVADRPSGFYCHRYVLASGEGQAKTAAFRRVRENLEAQTGWISAGFAALDLEAEELTKTPMHKLLRPDNRGHTFYHEG